MTLDPINLDTKGRFVGLRGGTRTGAADLGGTVRFSHTADALVVDTEVTDDVHHGARTGGLLWQTDSGSGVGTAPKNPALFRSAQLVAPTS